MLDAKAILLAALGLTSVLFAAVWGAAIRQTLAEPDPSAPDGRALPDAWELLVGLVTDFFDTLGIGSFATTTALYRLGAALAPSQRWIRHRMDDALIPGTLNVGHTIPTFLQAFIYTQLIEVDATTLVLMIAAAVAGAFLGAGWVANLDRRRVQLGMGIALLVAALVTLLRALHVIPGGDAIELRGALLAAGLVGNFALGALMTIGVGLYGPCLLLVSLLGMNPTAAFPIMMGSCAFLMPVANVQFIRHRRYALPAALGLTLAGTPAVWVAAKWVESMDLDTVQWLVVVVVVYTGATMLRAGLRPTAPA